MELIPYLVLHLLLLLGVPAGDTNNNSADVQKAKTEKEKSSSDDSIKMLGGTGTWGENGVTRKGTSGE